MSMKPDDTFTAEIGGETFTFPHRTVAFWIDWSKRYNDAKGGTGEWLETLAGMVDDLAESGPRADSLSPADLIDLCGSLPQRATLSDIDRKKSLRQSQSDTDASAPTAVTEAAA